MGGLQSSTWLIDETKILTTSEVKFVLADVKRRAERSESTRQYLIVFRLATCCGLRASEIAGLRVGDVRTKTEKPHIYVRKEFAKGGKSRKVPLWWDQSTLDDLAAWRALRINDDGAKSDDPFVCTRSKESFGQRLHRNSIRIKFRAACRGLGKDRLKHLSVHDGRHTFISHALKKKTLAQVRDAAGHSNVATTNLYVHIAVDEEEEIGNLFG